MWVNTAVETEFKKATGVESTPAFVVLRPHTKKLLSHDEKEISEESLKKLLDKLSGGDGKFKRLKELPALTAR